MHDAFSKSLALLVLAALAGLDCSLIRAPGSRSGRRFFPQGSICESSIPWRGQCRPHAVMPDGGCRFSVNFLHRFPDAISAAKCFHVLGVPNQHDLFQPSRCFVPKASDLLASADAAAKHRRLSFRVKGNVFLFASEHSVALLFRPTGGKNSANEIFFIPFKPFRRKTAQTVSLSKKPLCNDAKWLLVVGEGRNAVKVASNGLF